MVRGKTSTIDFFFSLPAASTQVLLLFTCRVKVKMCKCDHARTTNANQLRPNHHPDVLIRTFEYRRHRPLSLVLKAGSTRLT